jgi:hypothetical protein
MKKADIQTGPLTMPHKNPADDCWGGLGASHENGKHARPDPETDDGDKVNRRAAQDVARKDAPAKAPDK